MFEVGGEVSREGGNEIEFVDECQYQFHLELCRYQRRFRAPALGRAHDVAVGVEVLGASLEQCLFSSV